MPLYQVLSLAVPFVVRLTFSYKNGASDLYMSVNIRERHCDIIAQDQSLSTAIPAGQYQISNRAEYPAWFQESSGPWANGNEIGTVIFTAQHGTALQWKSITSYLTVCGQAKAQ